MAYEGLRLTGISSRLAELRFRQGETDGSPGSRAAAPTGAPKPQAGRAPAPAPRAAAAQFSKADVDQAVASAVARERARVASVFASAGSHGRERVCATLLSSPKGFSAARIVAELPTLPTDREHAAGPARDRAAIDAAWARAYAEPPTARGF